MYNNVTNLNAKVIAQIEIESIKAYNSRVNNSAGCNVLCSSNCVTAF